MRQVLKTCRGMGTYSSNGKPGSVADSHSSRHIIAVCSSNLPERSASSVIAFCLVLLRMGFSLLRFVTKCTVRSYRTFSPLPVLPEGNHRRYCFLFHFPSRCRARPLAGILLCGARTFLPVCLTRYAATVCPTCMKCGL